jgi:hypothetical protein
MNQRELKKRLAEFDTHVWDHTKDAFQSSFDVEDPLTAEDLALLSQLADAVKGGKDDGELADIIATAAAVEPSLLHTVMRLSGLTRSKPISDLRASSASSVVKIPTKAILLPNDPAVWAIAGPYVAERARRALAPVASLRKADRERAFEAMNVAAWPGWVRQKRAKLSGHQPEQRAATLLFNLGIPFEPAEKRTNPLCADAQFQNLSFDLVVPDVSHPKIVMRSTVQTSNIGQFGQSRAAEVVGAVQTLANLRAADRPELVALVDGVGFRSNPKGLEGVLQHVDQFCQFATLWKLASLAAGATKVKIEIALPKGHEKEHKAFIDDQPGGVKFTRLTAAWLAKYPAATYSPAGEAVIRTI